MTDDAKIERLAQAARAIGRSESVRAQWSGISGLADAIFGYSLLTGLVFLKEQRVMRRIFSSDESISPPGGFKATGKGPWSVQVLDEGRAYIGSDEADIRKVFSEAELLIGRGLHSVLNLPVWGAGAVVGSLNLLSRRHAYDQADGRMIELVAGICAPVFMLARDAERGAATGIDVSGLDSV